RRGEEVGLRRVEQHGGAYERAVVEDDDGLRRGRGGEAERDDEVDLVRRDEVEAGRRPGDGDRDAVQLDGQRRPTLHLVRVVLVYLSLRGRERERRSHDAELAGREARHGGRRGRGTRPDHGLLARSREEGDGRGGRRG